MGNNPTANLRPGKANCDRLLEMYGSVDMNRRRNYSRKKRRRRSLRYRSDVELYEDFDVDLDEYNDDDDEEEEEEYEEEDDDISNEDDSRYYFEDARSQYPGMSAEYEQALEELYYEISTQGKIRKQTTTQQHHEQREEKHDAVDVDVEPKKWRRLREHERGGDFSRKLNDGFVLEVHVLYPTNYRNRASSSNHQQEQQDQEQQHRSI